MRRQNQKIILTIIAFLVFLSIPAKSQAVKGTFLFSLSDFTGPIPYNWARVSVDRERNEIYVLYQNSVRIFNEAGMEVYRFGDDLDLGHIVDASFDPRGDIFLLTYKNSASAILRCNYRGEPQSKIELRNLPPPFSGFSPTRMIYQDGHFYLENHGNMTVVVTDQEGHFRSGYDLIPLLELEEKDRGNVEIAGFGVDKEGNILITVPVLFKACILSPDGKLSWFGRPGSVSGKFNIVAGIARDSRGNYLIVDKLKCAVMVFDKNFNFVTQFGSRGLKPGNLIAPDEIAIDDSDRIYVTQTRRRGVSVFKLTHDQ
jgi:DNA-binding beta-propeller fold protein YncE